MGGKKTKYCNNEILELKFHPRGSGYEAEKKVKRHIISILLDEGD